MIVLLALRLLSVSVAYNLSQIETYPFNLGGIDKDGVVKHLIIVPDHLFTLSSI